MYIFIYNYFIHFLQISILILGHKSNKFQQEQEDCDTIDTVDDNTNVSSIDESVDDSSIEKNTTDAFEGNMLDN